jgi:Carboxypeptidase regulatory-like domain/TonB dependent receptor
MEKSMKLQSLRHRLLLIAGMLLAVPALAQDAATGAIAGTVSDSSGAVIANAEVKVVSPDTNAVRYGKTNSHGVFHVPLLLPGSYTVTVSAAGFANRSFPETLVTVSETSSLNVPLSIQQVETNVEIKSGAEVAQLQSSSLGRAVDERAILALPLANRNYTQILGLSPGVVVSLPNAAQLGSGTQNVTSNGAKTTANNIQFNGVDANNLAQNSAANDAEEIGTGIPTPDSIQEFMVQTANFDAAYGRGSGANINLVTKAGTNQFHGSAWEFLRNNIFNANDFFVKSAGQPRPALKQNQFGAALGGPVLKDRTFFFVAYQGLTDVNGLGTQRSALLPMLTADRSAATLGAQFCPAGHLDGGSPAQGYLTHAGGTQVACNGSNINLAALAILNAKLPTGQFAVPSPQVPVPGKPAELPVGRSTFSIPAHYREDQFTTNIDHALDDKNTLSGRFFYSRATTNSPFAPNAANVPGWGADTLSRNTMFVLADTHIFNSSLVNVARVGYMRFDGVLKVQNPILATAVGVGTPTGAAGPTTAAPGLTIDGLFTVGDAGTPSQWQVTNSFIWQDTVSLTKGRHNLRFGAEFKRHQVDLDAPFVQDGLLDISAFADFLVGQSAAQNGSPIGSSNVTQSTGASGLSRKDTRYNDSAAFVQDDLKLTRRLTINAGVRYEIFGAPYEIHGLLPNFDPGIATGAIPDSGSFSGYILPSNFPGAVPAGYTKLGSRSLWSTRYGDVSPRLGFVLQLSEKPMVVLRGGYGVYYDRHSGNYVESQLGQPPLSTMQILSGSANGGATLQSPFAPLLPPASSYPIFTPRVPGGFPFLEGLSPDTVDGRTQEYNVNLQYAFASDYLLEVGYVGTRSTHRPGSIEFNQALLASPTHPVNGETTNSTNNLIQRLPFAGVSPGSLFTNSDFIANYNSLQSSITKRFRHGFQFLGSYTWSKSLDETSGSGGDSVFELWLLTNDQNNPRQAYGLTDFDRAQRGVFNFTYQAPKFLTMPTLVRRVLTDWQFSGIAVIQSGSPITVMDANAGSVYGNFLNRAQRTGKSPATRGSLFSRVINGYLDASAFTRAPEVANGTSLADQDFGNSGVGIVRGPGQHNLDFAVERIFSFTETRDLRFRTEFFNLTNTPQFANPNNNLGYGDPTAVNPTASPSFGKIIASAANPRIVQFAVKLSF